MITVYIQKKKRKTLIGQYPGTNVRYNKHQHFSEIVRALELATQDCSERELARGTLVIDGVELGDLHRKYLQTKGIKC